MIDNAGQPRVVRGAPARVETQVSSHYPGVMAGPPKTFTKTKGFQIPRGVIIQTSNAGKPCRNFDGLALAWRHHKRNV